MSVDANEAVTKIIALRHAEAALIKASGSRALAATHAESCAELTALLTEHADKLGLTSQTIALASEPKHK